MKIGALKYSFRFGPTLAEALSDFVYGEGKLIGRRQGNLIVEIVHVAGEPENDKCNIAQAKQAAAIARQLAPNSWSILTPYTNQRDAIKEELAIFRERVFTVHAAQGQEWDTVIYCTADSNRNSRFLNETSNQYGKPNQAGRECLNTALSRVRMRLILVLDRNHWENRPHQLLSRLIALSRH
jgi:superfamily I DNA/RNA helicase